MTPPGRGPGASEEFNLVPHIGFEPMISALRGRCPGPLDECGADASSYWGCSVPLEFTNDPVTGQQPDCVGLTVGATQ